MIDAWPLYPHFMTDLFSSNAGTASAGITADERRVLSVTDLNRQARMTIEQRFNQIWESGELSSFARPSSGHWYFTLKDAKAQVRCAMFANANRRARLQPANGQQVLVVILLSPRGPGPAQNKPDLAVSSPSLMKAFREKTAGTIHSVMCGADEEWCARERHGGDAEHVAAYAGPAGDGLRHYTAAHRERVSTHTW